MNSTAASIPSIITSCLMLFTLLFISFVVLRSGKIKICGTPYLSIDLSLAACSILTWSLLLVNVKTVSTPLPLPIS